MNLNSPNPWRFAVSALFLATVAALLLFHQAVGFLLAAWRTDNYSHGFLIFPISFYLVWVRRHRVTHLQPSPSPWGLIALLVCAAAWLLGNLVDVRSVEEMACVLAIIALVWCILGTRVVLAFRLPLAFLLFAVPLGDSLIPPLQDLTAKFAIWGLQATGIPSVLQGRVIETPSGFWEVAAACSGLRFLIASAVLGFLFAGLVYRSWIRRALFLVASVIVPILANGVRVYGIIVLGYLSNNRLAAGVDHLVYGWLFSTLVGVALFSIGWHWREARETFSEDGPIQSGGLHGETVESRSRPHFAIAKISAYAVLSIGLLAAGPLASHLLAARQVPSARPLLVAPSVSPPWVFDREDPGGWLPDSPNATGQLKQAYSDGVSAVDLYVAYYAPEAQGTDVVNAKPALYDAARWMEVSEGSTQVSLGGHSLTVSETVINSRSGARLLWSWYCVNGEFTAEAYHGKFREAQARLLGRRQGSALIALGAGFPSEKTQASNTLRHFLDHTSLGTELLPLCQ